MRCSAVFLLREANELVISNFALAAEIAGR
jgi:hypothetical protein